MPFAALAQISEDRALSHVQSYFEDQSNGRPWFTGSRFETFAGGGDQNEPHRITAHDLIAVSMLSVHVPAQAALGIIETLGGEIESLLEELPVDVCFEELSGEEFDTLLGDSSPAEKIWDLLRQRDDRWEVGQTTASKILARKRPQLIPVYDSVVGRAAGLKDSTEQWNLWFSSFHDANSEAGIERLRSLRAKSGQAHLSLLRILDIVLWMEHRNNASEAETVGDGG
ncbi:MULTISPECIES: DUF6308 family protein [Micrococcaceae]|uniref:Uncharacterized protein n=1 Tax=Arthrobacter rhombi TaxID=71253 RepID=A0A1R4FHH5_9MICC|nr:MULTISPECIES: DUF6308 family protein [Micrococcaceae]PCC26491.1 hypothetical protein CIK75_02835 [Glutamicibacter sp. BW78]SJM55212.1 hypothetical protein FM101_03905 [Arthrobacter rhombi]